MDPVELTLFSSRLNAICDEMGGVLRNAAFSPNIRDRLDFSCAIFDASGEICAQAAHIPVHLGSMAFAMAGIVSRIEWHPGDMIVFNDPYQGGTHLPDVTLVAPVYLDGVLMAFVANRAHHADIGAETPGSMPISSTLEEEGIVLSPDYLVREGEWQRHLLDRINTAARNPTASFGDFNAQFSANRAGEKRLVKLIERYGASLFKEGVTALNNYGEKLARQTIESIPDGVYGFRDYLDDDGQENLDLAIAVSLKVAGSDCRLDFTGTSPQVEGNVNCPLSVTAAGAYYVFRCLMPEQTPACAGIFRPIEVVAEEGGLLNARPPAAVTAGNVETSTRIVDVVMGALAKAIPDRIPAASHGSMNNLAMGSDSGDPWDYYETIGGGMGSGRYGGGLSAVQTHMTNTLNTPVEVIESYYPLRLACYEIRRGSGGEGVNSGGDGIRRSYRFLEEAQFTLLTERRRHRPWGIAGGKPGASGVNLLNGEDVGSKCHHHADAGDLLELFTAGGGGWGTPDQESFPISETKASTSRAVMPHKSSFS